MWATLALVLGLTLVVSGAAGLWLVRHRSKESPVKIPEPTVSEQSTPIARPVDPDLAKLDHTEAKEEPAPALPESKPPPPPAPVPASTPAVESEADRINRRAAELSALAAQEAKSKEAQLADQEAVAQPQGGTIPWSSRALLLENEGKGVVVEGTVDSIGPSSSGKTLYVWFGNKTEKNAARVGFDLSGADPASVTDSLTPFLGKKIRVSGTVVVRKNFGNDRPDIMIKETSAIKLAE
jgi:type IV secretory pathway VirB10-like protein